MSERKQLNVRVSPDLFREVKIRAATESRDVKSLVSDAITAYLKKRTPTHKQQSVA